jgi:hypothetical protein
VSALPDHVLDNQELLEGFALEAFEQAAAANLPPVLSESVYRERPDLLESQQAKCCWVMLPLRRRKRYKKCGRTFKVRITPYLADEIETFEGPLSDYLHDQLGVEEGAAVEAEVSLYETLPGTMLPDIAREESQTLPLHPLTTKAAGLLLGEPRLGRNLLPGTHRRNVGVGQRLYHLDIRGARPLQSRRMTGLWVIFDGSRDEITVTVFLSERKAQRLAVKLRKQAHAGTATAWLNKYVHRHLGPIIRGERAGHIRAIHGGLPVDAWKQLPAEVSNALTAKLQEWIVGAFADFVKEQSQRIVAASEEPADGITLTFTVVRPAGLQQLAKALMPNGSTTGLAAAIQSGSRPEVRVTVHAGYKR